MNGSACLSKSGSTASRSRRALRVDALLDQLPATRLRGRARIIGAAHHPLDAKERQQVSLRPGGHPHAASLELREKEGPPHEP